MGVKAPSDLVKRQHRFAQEIALLLIEAAAMGYLVTVRECWRPEYTARFFAKLGIGSKLSKHIDSLALDLVLRRPDGSPLTETDDYRQLGRWWKDRGHKWGGDFPRSDGGHFEE